MDLAVAVAGRDAGRARPRWPWFEQRPLRHAERLVGLQRLHHRLLLHSVDEAGGLSRPVRRRRSRPRPASGGMIMPPIMGVGAFVMAEMTAIPYWTIAKCAALSRHPLLRRRLRHGAPGGREERAASHGPSELPPLAGVLPGVYLLLAHRSTRGPPDPGLHPGLLGHARHRAECRRRPPSGRTRAWGRAQIFRRCARGAATPP